MYRGAPEGSVVANAATDNYAAGELAAEKTYEVLKDRIAAAEGSVRIGVMGQDATSESIVNRGLGFIDKIAELAEADGYTVTVEGNDKYVQDSKVEPTDDAKSDSRCSSTVTGNRRAVRNRLPDPAEQRRHDLHLWFQPALR